MNRAADPATPPDQDRPRRSITQFPQRIVCLTEETTETLYLLGEGDRVVGVSGYTVRPPEARTKPRVSAFVSARYDKVLELRPDLVFAFSDMQADVTAELVRLGAAVFAFNQRSLREILEMVLTVARLVGAESKGLALVDRLEEELAAVASSAARFQRRPRVFFEEWHDPLISGIRWVDELLEVAGGSPTFPELRASKAARERIVTPADVVVHNPEVIVASWCGRKVKKSAIRSRPGWSQIAAVRTGRIYEIASACILQPGPAALTEGVRQLHAILAHTLGFDVEPRLRPAEPLDADLLNPAASYEPR